MSESSPEAAGQVLHHLSYDLVPQGKNKIGVRAVPLPKKNSNNR